MLFFDGRFQVLRLQEPIKFAVLAAYRWRHDVRRRPRKAMDLYRHAKAEPRPLTPVKVNFQEAVVTAEPALLRVVKIRRSNSSGNLWRGCANADTQNPAGEDRIRVVFKRGHPIACKFLIRWNISAALLLAIPHSLQSDLNICRGGGAIRRGDRRTEDSTLMVRERF